MRNPLSVFRRHQKVLLVVFGVLIMITFTIGGSISLYQDARRMDPDTEVVVTWRHGRLRGDDLVTMRNLHAMTVRFLDLLVLEALEAGGNPSAPGITRDPSGQIRDPGIPRSFSEEDLVQTMILAREARNMGVAISDEAILEFLDQVSDYQVPRARYGELLRQASGGRLLRQQLFEQLRMELRAQNLRMFASTGLFAITPGIAWEYFDRFHRRVRAEILPLAAEDFVDRVTADPTEAEILALYEEGKDRFPDPESPLAGFRRPRRIAFEYLKADFETFLEQEMAKVSEQEVEQYYQENLDDFRRPELPPVDDDFEIPLDDEEPATDDEEPATDDEEPATDDEEPVSSDEDSAARHLGSGDLFFVRLDEAGDEDPADEEPVGDTEPADSEDEEPVEQPPPDAPTETLPALEPPLQEPQADEAAEPAEAEPAEAEPAEEELVEDTDAPPSYRSLEEVADQIRRTLARENAQAAVDRALQEARSEVNTYFRARIPAEAMDEELPPPLDVEALAEKHGLIPGSTPLVDMLEVEDYELGQAHTFTFADGQVRTVSFAEQAYVEGVPLYRPEQIRSFETNLEYLYWRTEEKPPFTPDLHEVRDEVIQEWRLREALRMARNEAEALAEESRPDAPLRETVDEVYLDQVLETGEFSWMTRGATPGGFGQPAIGSVEGVDSPGEEFMEQVFGLQPGEATAATNAPQTAVYVVRLLAETPEEAQRRQNFLESGVTGDTLHLAFRDRESLVRDWYRNLEQQMDVRWLRPPDRPYREDF